MSPHAALVADGAEVLIDAEYDQDELRSDAREHDADDDAGDRGKQHQKTAERADRHRGEAGKDTGNTHQADQRNNEPVERLDDGGRDETVLPVLIRGIPSASTISSLERGVGKRSNSPITAESLANKLMS
jgi:hypothetical protein